MRAVVQCRLICCAAVIVFLFLLGEAVLVAASERPRQYLISATSGVTTSVPATKRESRHLYRNAQGKWLPLPNFREAAGAVTFTLSPEQLAGGRTVILLNKPKWLVAEDRTPPVVKKVIVDGKEVAPSSEINLGWLDALPKTLEVVVADAQNPLDASSVCVTVGDRTVRAGGSGCDFIPNRKDMKKGRIVCSLPKLGLADVEHTRRIVVRCDDFAADDNDCKTTFIFTVMRTPEIDISKPAATNSEGIKVFVDSIYPGYENVDCLLDGKLQAPGTTTFGSTWASAETETAHWMCFVLPKSRQLSGIEISWANYENTFWTSQRYAIMTWDGKQWVKVLKVERNPEAQTSVHRFAPRMTDRVLVFVPPGGNHPRRPYIMWVTEVRLLSDGAYGQ